MRERPFKACSHKEDVHDEDVHDEDVHDAGYVSKVRGGGGEADMVVSFIQMEMKRRHTENTHREKNRIELAEFYF